MKSKTTSASKAREVSAYLEKLYSVWGPQNWWPADSAFEVIVGAILTQNTAWTNVEKALNNLRQAGTLSLRGVRECSAEHLEQMVRPAGYFRQKAARLKRFVAWLDAEYDGSLDKMFHTDAVRLRKELLALNGIGPETADSILLYAGQKEIFVVDAYTRRIFDRHRLTKPNAKYDEIRVLVESAISGELPALHHPRGPKADADIVEPGPGPAEELPAIAIHRPSRMSEQLRSELARRYNEFHALLVQTAKHSCQSRVARCEQCPLRPFLPTKLISRQAEKPARLRSKRR